MDRPVITGKTTTVFKDEVMKMWMSHRKTSTAYLNNKNNQQYKYQKKY